jgi:hypothetical protein
MPLARTPTCATAQAEVLLPSVTTITLNTLELSAPGMVEWSDKMEMPPRPGDLEPDEPVTLVVVNPGGDDSIELTVQTAVRSDVLAAAAEQAKLSQQSARPAEADRPDARGTAVVAPTSAAERTRQNASEAQLPAASGDALPQRQARSVATTQNYPPQAEPGRETQTE